MDCQHYQITLYTAQSEAVVQNIKENGVHYAKKEYIRQKYGEVAQVFLEAYHWYTEHASTIVPKPPEAESGIWTFADCNYLEQHAGSSLLKLSVPIQEAVFFRMSDWNKILNYRYMGTEQQEADFRQKLSRYGIRYESDVYTSPFYPQLKRELVKSWDNLFQYHPQVQSGKMLSFPDMQAALWRICDGWIISCVKK